MNREYLSEGNKLIAEFMNIPTIALMCSENNGPLVLKYAFDLSKISGKTFDHYIKNDREWLMPYGNDWNYLITVARKCINSYADNRQDIFASLHDCDIKKLYAAIVKYIKWYNLAGKPVWDGKMSTI